MATKSQTEWGKVEKMEIVPPVQFVKNKADIFNGHFPQGQMRCIVKEDVNTSESDPFDLFTENNEVYVQGYDRVVHLILEVPVLNNYRIHLIKVSYKLSELYPCKLDNCVANEERRCETMEKFESTLNAMLVSESISRTLSILRAQIPD